MWQPPVQLQGKELSFNNIADTDAALECVKQFDQPACVIVKHANPCGVAVAVDINTAYDLAFATDPESAFGGIIAFNRELDAATAETICEKQFVEVIIAPSVSADAVAADGCQERMCGYWNAAPGELSDLRTLTTNGLMAVCLFRTEITAWLQSRTLKWLPIVNPQKIEMSDMMFAWKVAKMVKSNAIIYAKNNPHHRCWRRTDEPH